MLDILAKRRVSLFLLLYPIRKYNRLQLQQLQQLNICIHIFTYTQNERKRTSEPRTTVVGFVSYLRIAILNIYNFVTSMTNLPNNNKTEDRRET